MDAAVHRDVLLLMLQCATPTVRLVTVLCAVIMYALGNAGGNGGALGPAGDIPTHV
jgi:hypothetical protein